jgi:plasmid stabilization system protein ParE
VFQATEEELIVLRVLHGHQDLRAIDFKQEEN